MARVLCAPLAANLYAIGRHHFTLLFEDADDSHRRATPQGNQQQLDGRGRARALVIRVERLRVPARADADKEIVPGEMDGSFRVFSAHKASFLPFNPKA